MRKLLYIYGIRKFTIGLFCAITIFLGSLFSCQSGSFKQGERLYKENCAGCHQENGQGLGKLYPPIRSADYWKKNQKHLPCIIRYGMSDTIKVNGVLYGEEMKGLPHLSNAEISNIINYINQSWYEGIPVLQIKELKQQLKNCPKN